MLQITLLHILCSQSHRKLILTAILLKFSQIYFNIHNENRKMKYLIENTIGALFSEPGQMSVELMS